MAVFWLGLLNLAPAATAGDQSHDGERDDDGGDDGAGVRLGHAALGERLIEHVALAVAAESNPAVVSEVVQYPRGGRRLENLKSCIMVRGG